MKDESCIDCGSKEGLVEAGGQFCGGTWWVCETCDEDSARVANWMKSEEFKELLSKHTKKGSEV